MNIINLLALLVVTLFLLGGIALYNFYRTRLLKTADELHARQQQLQKDFDKEIALRNFKLAMSLEVSTLQSWVFDISCNVLLFDDIKKMVDNPHDTDNTFEVPRSHLFSVVNAADVVRMEAAIKRLIDGQVQFVKEELRMVMPGGDGTENWYSMQAVVYERDEVGKPIKLIGTFLLITDSKMVELELRKAKEAADESNRLQSAFLANMSHEIRTPLNAIVGFSGIIARSKNEDEKQELAAIVEHNNDLLLGLINNILDLSKIESGVVSFTNVSTNANKVLDEVFEEFHVNVSPDVQLTLDKPLPECFIITERERLKQVMAHFVSNAVKFTKQGAIKVGYYAPHDSLIRFYVKDTGCGIPKDKQQIVFGRFVKLNNFEQGTGLGLSLCQIIATRMNGQIGVYSEVGSGSEFWIEIPYIESDTKIDAVEGDPKEEANKPAILVAEDNESNYRVIKGMLHNKYRVIHAWDGQEAVNMFKEYNPRLVLMDVRMPVKDGYAATAEIRKLSSTVPIIAVSAYAFNAEDEALKADGFSGYEPKPLNKSSLQQHVDALLDDK